MFWNIYKWIYVSNCCKISSKIFFVICQQLQIKAIIKDLFNVTMCNWKLNSNINFTMLHDLKLDNYISLNLLRSVQNIPEQRIMFYVNVCCHAETFHAFREYSTILNIQRRKTKHYSSLGASRPEHTSIFATLILL